jgi:hypothetical protein
MYHWLGIWQSDITPVAYPSYDWDVFGAARVFNGLEHLISSQPATTIVTIEHMFTLYYIATTRCRVVNRDIS